jgi:hypothetical protein
MTVSCWYLVVESLGKWWVDCEGKPFGPFDEMDEATEGAIRLATVLGDNDRQLQVMVPDEQGRFRIVWEKSRAEAHEFPSQPIPAKPD